MLYKVCASRNARFRPCSSLSPSLGSIAKAPDSKARAGSLLRGVVLGNIRGCAVSLPVKMKFFVVRFG